MAFYTFLKPSKTKIILSLILPFAWLLVYLFVLGVRYILNQPVNYLALLSFSPSAVIWQIVYYYPFACYISKLMDERRKGTKIISLKNMIAFSLALLIFNPIIAFALYYSLLYVFTSAPGGSPCGALVLAISENSPAQAVGLARNETILFLDEKRGWYIESAVDLQQVLGRLEAGSIIYVVTDYRRYKITLGENPITGTPSLGINATTKYCDCGNGVCEVGEKIRFYPSDDSYNRCPADCA